MYLTKEALLAAMEEIAPRALAESWDNVGLLIDCGQGFYKKALFALELTEEVAKEAEELGADLLVTHHPVMLFGVKRLDQATAESRAMLRLVQNGVSMFAAHTNFDCCATGTNALLAEELGLLNVQPMLPAEGGAVGMGRVGELPAPLRFEEFARQVARVLKAEGVRTAGDPARVVRCVAVCTGAGLMVKEALRAGAEVIVTGDVKHHQAAEAVGQGLWVVDAGHFETEQPAVKRLFAGLQQRYNQLKYNAQKEQTTEFCLSRVEKPVLSALVWTDRE